MRVLNVVLLAAGLSLVWPVAASASSPVQQIDRSPSASVVARAPRAVSVTFNGALDSAGASMRIWGPDGEVSAAQAQVVGNAVRRAIDDSVPKGRYTVIWTARGKDGSRMRGSFSFTAASGTGSYVASEPGATPQPGAIQPPATLEPTPTTATTAVPAVPAPAVLPSNARPGSGSLSARLLVVPIVLGALLVLASATVGLISSARRQPSFAHRRLALPWQRHQS